jgi:DNA-binding HxlR family transcriptional regulator
MRFSDLARSLGGITPTRLTDRLRSLEAAGLIIRDTRYFAEPFEAPEGRAKWTKDGSG